MSGRRRHAHRGRAPRDRHRVADARRRRRAVRRGVRRRLRGGRRIGAAGVRDVAAGVHGRVAVQRRQRDRIRRCRRGRARRGIDPGGPQRRVRAGDVARDRRVARTAARRRPADDRREHGDGHGAGSSGRPPLRLLGHRPGGLCLLEPGDAGRRARRVGDRSEDVRARRGLSGRLRGDGGAAPASPSGPDRRRARRGDLPGADAVHPHRRARAVRGDRRARRPAGATRRRRRRHPDRRLPADRHCVPRPRRQWYRSLAGARSLARSRRHP